MGWEWVVVRCLDGCDKYVTVPPDDPFAKDGWRCNECQYMAPNHRIPDFLTEGPEMSDLPQARKGDNTCLCGCGRPTRHNYAQGHDAQHVSKLTAEVMAGVRSRSSALRQINSTLLKEKLRKSLDRAAEKAKAAQRKGGDDGAADHS